MAKPRFAQGHNGTGSYAALSFNCSLPGIDYPERRFGVDGLSSEHGMGYTKLLFLLTWTDYKTLLTELGLSSSVESAYGTIELEPFDGDGLNDYNCTVHRPKLFDNVTYGDSFRKFYVDITDMEEL